MLLSEEQILSYEGMEIDEIRKDLENKNYSRDEIKMIISQIDDWRIKNVKLRQRRRQAFSFIVAGTVLSLVAASVFLFLYFSDEFKGKTGMFTIIILMIGYLLIRAGRTMLRQHDN